MPKVKRFLAYLPEGPVIDWTSDHLSDWLAPMTRHLAGKGAFGVRMGPPVVTRRWTADAVKKGIADDSVRTLGDVPPAERSQVGASVVSQLRELGWRPQSVEGGFAAGQPQYNFQIPLAGRTEDDVLKGMNQQWRRNIKKAAKEGVTVTRVDADDLERELPAFWELYRHTAERDHFTPRPLSYFQTMFAALRAEEPDRIVLYTARHEGDLVAATILVRVGGHTWYSYGASSTEKRECAAPTRAVGDDLGHARVRRRRLRPARHHRHPRPRRPARGSHPVQGRHRRRGRRVRRRVGPPAELADLQGVRPLHEASRLSPGPRSPLVSLSLYVDGDRWRGHLRGVLDSHPGLVPVLKGNGYGFGLHRLARKAAWLGVDTVAVGTYDEVEEVTPRFDGSVLVLTPWRPFEQRVVYGDRVVHTVGRLEDLQALAARDDRPRVVLERMTSMRRHGFSARGSARPPGCCRRAPTAAPAAG